MRWRRLQPRESFLQAVGELLLLLLLLHLPECAGVAAVCNAKRAVATSQLCVNIGRGVRHRSHMMPCMETPGSFDLAFDVLGCCRMA